MQKNAVMLDDASLFCVYPKFIESAIFITKRLAVFKILQQFVDQTRHKKGRRAKPRNWFYIIICGRFESK